MRAAEVLEPLSVLPEGEFSFGGGRPTWSDRYPSSSRTPTPDQMATADRRRPRVASWAIRDGALDLAPNHIGDQAPEDAVPAGGGSVPPGWVPRFEGPLNVCFELGVEPGW